MTNEFRQGVVGRPTLKGRARRVLGSIVCRRRGHRPVLADSTYHVYTGETVQIEESVSGVPVTGYDVDRRTERAPICSRCWARVGD